MKRLCFIITRFLQTLPIKVARASQRQKQWCILTNHQTQRSFSFPALSLKGALRGLHVKNKMYVYIQRFSPKFIVCILGVNVLNILKALRSSLLHCLSWHIAVFLGALPPPTYQWNSSRRDEQECLSHSFCVQACVSSFESKNNSTHF